MNPLMGRFSLRSLFLLTCFVATLTFSCLHLYSLYDDAPFVQRCLKFEGKSVADVLADADVQAREHGTFNEPPGVLRGISVVTNDGRFVTLSIKRYPELFPEELEWDEQFFARCEIVSVSIHGQKRSLFGQLGIAR